MTNTEIIEQIHHEFNMARVKTLTETYHFLETKSFSEIEDYEKAIKLGLSRSKTIRNYISNKEEFLRIKTLGEAIVDYKVRYPANRFISEKDVRDICSKYNLLRGEKDCFIGEIPNDCLKKIVDFKLKDEDIKISSPYGDGLIEDERFYKNPLAYFSHFNDGWSFLRRSFKDSYDFITSKTEGKTTEYFFDREKFEIVKDDFTNKNDFTFVGTPDQFDLRKMRVSTDGEIIPILNDDPICLKPVKHGYLIIAMWELEAQLDEVKDITLN